MDDSSSTLRINFSLRQNKAIERAIAFECLRRTAPFLGDAPVYVGLGSLWFQDFQLAHRMLGSESMISIEGSSTVFKRQSFNRPYACIELLQGMTTEVIPRLLERSDLAPRPWIAWLDYDHHLDDGRLDEMVDLVQHLEPGSALLTTFNANPDKYASDLDERRSVILDLFGDVVDPDIPDEDLRGARFMRTLADALSARLVAAAVRAGREVPFVPSVRLMYRDSARMVTIGGFLPRTDTIHEVEELVLRADWRGFEDEVIETQPLTVREVQALTKLLPRDDVLTVDEVAALGFELPTEQLSFFQRHYLRYPMYAEIV